ncbi:MAG: outer membrane lipoprotein-sorting protein [Desulfobacterales bacterium]|nr:outer membrane lipoprotein-sorting protein [Desulfobacterales bacterium]
MFIRLFIFLQILYLPFTTCVNASELTGYDIAYKSYHVENGDDMKAMMMMKIVKPGGTITKRDVEYYRKDFGQETRSVYVIKSPPNVKGTALLTWAHPDKETYQWVYFPALNKVTRIGSSSQSKEFLGSDASYEDLSLRNLNKDEFKLIRKEDLDSIPCYVVEAISKDQDEIFTKRIYWIRKDNFLIVKVEYYDNSGTMVKRMLTNNIVKIGNIWTILSYKMENLKTHGYSILEQYNIEYNTDLSERMFRVQGLKNDPSLRYQE